MLEKASYTQSRCKYINNGSNILIKIQSDLLEGMKDQDRNNREDDGDESFESSDFSGEGGDNRRGMSFDNGR